MKKKWGEEEKGFISTLNDYSHKLHFTKNHFHFSENHTQES